MICSNGRWPHLVVSFVAVALLAGPAADAKKKKRGDKPTDPNELFNPLLGIEHSRWLVGPIARIARAEEIERYLRLTNDADADAFIKAFWEERNEGTPIFQQTPEELFGERMEEADKRFSEGATVGSQTDRGTIFVVFGEPTATSYEKPRTVGDPAPEVWEYDKDAKPGIGGEAPERRYRFIKLGDTTVFFTEQMRRDPRLRDPFLRTRSGRSGG